MSTRSANSSRNLAVLTATLLCAAAAASAAPLPVGEKSSGPNCKVALDFPEWRGVWLGHFSGGKQIRDGSRYGVVDWRDDYVCFPSRAGCERWQRSMRKAYRNVEGYRTCVVIRSGPMGAPPVVLTTRY